MNQQYRREPYFFLYRKSNVIIKNSIGNFAVLLDPPYLIYLIFTVLLVFGIAARDSKIVLSHIIWISNSIKVSFKLAHQLVVRCRLLLNPNGMRRHKQKYHYKIIYKQKNHYEITFKKSFQRNGTINHMSAPPFHS